MIYDNPFATKAFDESIIKSVDALITNAYNRELVITSSNISATKFRSEFRELLIKLPRQCGKTTYLQKLYRYFSKKNISCLVVVPREQFYNFYANDIKVISNPTLLDSSNYEPNIILYDEVKPEDIEVLGKQFTIGLYT